MLSVCEFGIQFKDGPVKMNCLEDPMKTVLLPNSKKLCPGATNVRS